MLHLSSPIDVDVVFRAYLASNRIHSAPEPHVSLYGNAVTRLRWLFRGLDVAHLTESRK